LKYLEELEKQGKYWFEDKTKKFVCLFEKPSQIKAINAVFPAKETKHIKNISLAGHTMRLKNIDEYDPSLKNMTWYQLVKQNKIPFIPDEFELVIKEKSTGKFKTDYEDMVLSAKRAFDQADYIVLMVDPDNEGCALGMEVIQYAGVEHKVIGMVNMSKLDYHSLKEEIKVLDKIPYELMAEAGFARSEFDWTFGINHTILASVLLGQGQTRYAGGVKLPILRMVKDRMDEIENFVPEKFWTIDGQVKHEPSGEIIDFKLKIKIDTKELNRLEKEIEELENQLEKANDIEKEELYSKLGKLRWEKSQIENENKFKARRIFDKKLKSKLMKYIKENKNMSITDYSEKHNLTQNPPLAYSLTDLQAEAGSIHGLTPAKTLETAQKLYEKQIQSYPRTDNRYYSQGEMANIQKIIPNLLKLNKFQNVNIPTPYKVKTGVFNSAKVSAHTGLAPTSKDASGLKLTNEEQIIYEMVATRYLIQFMDKFEYTNTTAIIDIDDTAYLEISENIQTKRGWRELYDPKNLYGFSYNEKRKLPQINQGDKVTLVSIKDTADETKPPAPFTEFGLLKGMENISRIYKSLKGLEKGIGTPATRASILSDLFKTKSMIRKGKVITLPDSIYEYISILPDKMTSPELRADMESKLNLIVEGKLSKRDFEDEFAELVREQAKELYQIAKEKNIPMIDKDTLTPTENQIKFAKQIAKELKIEIPKEALKLKNEMTKWIKKYEPKIAIQLSEKQYNFIKNYGSHVPEMVEILKAHDEKKLTKKQKMEASKWLGAFMRTSEYHKARAAKAKETRKKNREAKLKALGVDPTKPTNVKLKRKKVQEDESKKSKKS